MSTCKDCAHVDICEFYAKTINNGLRKYYEPEIPFDKDRVHSEPCELFKDRSRFVELPCKVGDTVYFNNAHFRYAKVMAIYIDASGGMFDLKIFTNIETVAGYEHFINKDYTFEDIGKRLFLTKEAAEQALKERELTGEQLK